MSELDRKLKGLILYPSLLVHFIKENFSLLTPKKVNSTLLSGIPSVYQTYFKRLERELGQELKIKDEHFVYVPECSHSWKRTFTS